MCGIIGVLAKEPVQGMLLDGLRRMEYRGYDSAGICVASADGFASCKQPGKLVNLAMALEAQPLDGYCGIGHTRWATHGSPTEYNAHPHLSDTVAVVHNGIIENHDLLRCRLREQGATFASDTDTEVIPWLFSHYIEDIGDVLPAWQATLSELEGSFAVAAMVAGDQEHLWFARRGSPLLLGRGNGALYAASDAMALAGMASEVLYLEEGDHGCLSLNGDVCIVDAGGRPVTRAWQVMPVAPDSVDKGGFRHYMEKEIHEQPRVVADILGAYVHDGDIRFPGAAFITQAPLPKRIVMVACGTSFHAALTARYWLEHYLQIPVEVDVASEYRYRDPVIGPDTWLLILSQSGETADTLEALRLFKGHTPGNRTLAMVNVPHSSIARESEGVVELHAGPEIGVASTKAFTAQLVVLMLFALALARRADAMSAAQVQMELDALHGLVSQLGELLRADARVEQIAAGFGHVRGALFLGRGPCYPVALEGALKLKEISYMHAEGYAAGEMKHGPIALIDENLPVIVIAPVEHHLEKVLSNLEEVRSRGARVILITDMPEKNLPRHVEAVIRIPRGNYFIAPLLATIPLQLLAYHVARLKGTDVDQPRNLAKSVTVE
ncbi:MAG: glutamine--fructose-6-phosphate transaminase (isomerizing) [Mariprofundaceae bacterium]|nr:glutamine--fructose-6-phosphate transaminase (isomerizing) [Mariprofundaceae bacterium]